MLKSGSLIQNKFRKLMIPNVIYWASYCINVMMDSIIGGNQLGETALTAVTIVAPMFQLFYFMGYMVSPGYGVLYGQRNGAFDKDGAYRMAGQSIVSAVGIGIVSAILLLLIKNPYLSYYGCTGELYKYASDYYNWVVIYDLLMPLMGTIYYLILADGDGTSIMIGNIFEIICNVVLSCILCGKYGTAGLGMATVIALLGNVFLEATHFLKTSNSVHFILCFKWNDFTNALRYSISRFTGCFFLALVDIIINKVIIQTCSVTLIPAYSVVNLGFSLFEICGAVFDSCESFLATFMGEKNNYGIRCVMKNVSRSIVIMCIILSALFFGSATLIPKIYGITTPETVAASIRAARFMALSALPFGVAYLGVEIYATLNQPKLSLFMAFLYSFAGQIILPVPLAYLFGFNGLCLGMALSTWFAVLVFTIVIISKKGKSGFPLYLEDYGEEIVAFDISVEKDNIVAIRDAVASELAGHGYDIGHVDLLIEELYTRIIEKNPGKKVLSECVLFFGENSVRIIIRDNGVVFNFIDEDNVIESLSAHVLNSLVERTPGKSYILTTSFNRNGFVFNK